MMKTLPIVKKRKAPQKRGNTRNEMEGPDVQEDK
jgi:hypothetical protein